jgi:ABC-type sugar transport system permease subunit
MNSFQKREAVWGYLFLTPALVFLIVFMLYATLVGIQRSFTDWNLLSLRNYSFVGIDNYLRLVNDEVFLRTLKNLFFILLGKIVIQVGGGLLIANILHTLRLFKRLLRMIYFMPAVVAPVAVGLAWSYLFEGDLGLVTRAFAALGIDRLAVPWLSDPTLSLVAVIMVDSWQWVSLPMVLFLAGLQAIPDELYEAAKIDGANSMQLFRHITIPGLWAVTTVVIILVSINGIKMFDLIRAMTRGGPYHRTETPATWLFQIGLERNDLGYACAIATVVVAICFLVTVMELRILEREE